jgi:hypothetical protein
MPPSSTRRLEVAPERLERWLDGFAERHGPVTVTAYADRVELRAADGAAVTAHVPFPPLAECTAAYAGLVAHALAERRVGVLLVRLGGYAVGVFQGATLTASKVGARPVHGRSAAGGQSQQRFARRREGQARVALAAAADTAARVLLPVADILDAVVVGGDRRALDTVLEDRRLAPLVPLVGQWHLDVPEPRRAVLDDMPRRFRAVRIDLTEPAGAGPAR